MNPPENLGQSSPTTHGAVRLTGLGIGLLLGWTLASIGYFGPWIAHATAALTLSGVDLGEFVKFLPEVIDGSLTMIRHLLYLPPFAVVVGVALLVGSPLVGYPGPVRLLILAMSVPVSLQLLPPAWSVSSLVTAEFLPQTAALGLCWLLLILHRAWGRLPLRLTGSASGLLAVAAAGLSGGQFLTAKPGVDGVYAIPPAIGWGFFLCMTGLLIAAATALVGAWLRQD